MDSTFSKAKNYLVHFDNFIEKKKRKIQITEIAHKPKYNYL